MEKINIGIANLIISNKLKEAYFNDNLIEESRNITTDFFDVVKNSPVLQLEFQVFNSLENKHISNDFLIKEYVDNNIRLFETYTREEIQAEHKKLSNFLTKKVIPTINEADYDLDKINLYQAMSTLIMESLQVGGDVDVDGIHEAFSTIINHIKTPKKNLIESVDVEPINEEVLEIAVRKYNEKYAELNEDDKDLLQKLIKSSEAEKQTLLESMKTESLTILEGMNNDKLQDGITKAIQKIKEMVYDAKNVDDNIIGLHELKRELL